MTNNLIRRVGEHKQGLVKGFTQKYNVHKLIYFEQTNDPLEAIRREKSLKNLLRHKKIALIESVNKNWEDLYFSLLK